tara:strand:+ start:2923 stop:3300 length:378 start_codon:yes stop_codon:yes gene_type:complete
LKTIRLALLVALIFLVSCASARRESAAHHHHVTECGKDGCKMTENECDMKKCSMKSCQMYEGKCAYSVAHGDVHVKGKKEYKLVHDGHVYFFSSAEKMNMFKKDIEKGVQKANENWEAFKWQQLR